MGVAVAVLAALVLAWSLVGRRLEAWGLTGPMVFLAAGILLGDVVDRDLSPETIRLLAEITLVVVLFHDASTVRLSALRRDVRVPLRLLAIGFPLALVTTAATTMWLLPSVGVAAAVLIAGSVTPTDAGLGAATILNPSVPVRVRRALNVESGLNDGLATPVVLGALAVLVETSGGREDARLSLELVAVLGGVAVGALLGVGGAYLLDRSADLQWSSRRARALGVLVLPVLAYGVAEAVGANVFIAAFVAGLLFGRTSGYLEQDEQASETLEIAADLLGATLWFLAGGLVLVALASGFQWRWLVLALAVLTVLRVVPVALALWGTGLRWPTVLFLGWFGPRGVATIVFGLLAAESLEGSVLLDDIAGVLGVTVLLSVVAHGLTATPWARRYGAWAAASRAPIEQEPAVEPMPSRGRPARQR